MRLRVFSDGRSTGQWVPFTVISPPSGPGTLFLNPSTVLHSAISFEMFLAVGSTAASILSMTLRYLYTLVWSTPKIACSVPCVGLSFLRTSAISRACLRCSLHLLPGSETLDSSSQNSGVSPEAVTYASTCRKMYWNSSMFCRVAECRFDSSDMIPSNTSILCRSLPALESHSAFLLFHRLRSRSRSLSFCSSDFLSLAISRSCSMVFFFKVLFSRSCSMVFFFRVLFDFLSVLFSSYNWFEVRFVTSYFIWSIFMLVNYKILIRSKIRLS